MQWDGSHPVAFPFLCAVVDLRASLVDLSPPCPALGAQPSFPCVILSSPMRPMGCRRACRGGGRKEIQPPSPTLRHLSRSGTRLHFHLPLCVIAVSPKITEISPDISINEGGNVSLTCIATGRPDPTITWRHISPKGKSRTLLEILREGHRAICERLERCRRPVHLAIAKKKVFCTEEM